MSEKLKAIYHRLNEEAWNQGNIDLIDELLSPNFVVHNTDGTELSFEEWKKNSIDFLAIWPDVHYATEHLVAEGETLAAHWTMRATHTSRITDLDLDATGNEVAVTGMAFYRFQDDRIAEMWLMNDMLGWLQQLGVTPPMD